MSDDDVDGEQGYSSSFSIDEDCELIEDDSAISSNGEYGEPVQESSTASSYTPQRYTFEISYAGSMEFVSDIVGEEYRTACIH